MVQKKNQHKLYRLYYGNLKSYKKLDQSLFGVFSQCFVDRIADRVQVQEC